jgi:hypothetical protein|tara:strand:+ start:244 stop:681 length:438 start_codon:yes stop_codon:yes gene_type:complete
MSNILKLTDERKTLFLESLTKTANVSLSAKAVKVSRQYMYKYKHRPENEEFAEAWDNAIEIGIDSLEEEARRRAYLGVDEPVFYQGRECGVIRRYSDTLLIFLLKANRPEKYKDRRDITTGDQPITVVINDQVLPSPPKLKLLNE